MKDLRYGKNLYRACLSKIQYKTYDYAMKKAQYYEKKFNKPQYVYWCDYCGGYHITSKARCGKEENYGTTDSRTIKTLESSEEKEQK